MKNFIKTLFVGAVTVFGLSFSVSAEERVVAMLNGQPIMQSQVKKALGKKANTAANQRIALDSVIDDILIQKAIEDSGVKIDYAQVDKMIEGIAAQNGLTYGQLLDALDYQGISLSQYRQQLAHQMMMHQVRDVSIGKAIQVEPEEVQKLAKQMLNQANAKGKAQSATQYRISHILIKTNPILNDAQAKAQLTRLAAEIKAGRLSFEEAAKQHSVDYASGADGGDLGWNLLSAYDPAFANTANASKIGVISAPFKSQFGWHILKVSETRKVAQTEEAYMQKAYESLVNQKGQALAQDWIKALRQQAEIQYIQ